MIISVMNVEMLLAINKCSLSTRKPTLEQDPLSTLGESLLNSLVSLNTREFTVGQCVMRATSVRSALKTAPCLLLIREFTLGEGVLSAGNVEDSLDNASHLRDIRKLTLEKDLTSVVNVGNALSTSRITLDIGETTLEKKPYECSICSRLFSQNSHLTRHQDVHIREKT